MNGHGTSDISDVKHFKKNHSVQGLHDCFESGEEEHLREGDLAEEGTHRDQDGGRTKLGFDKHNHVEVDLFFETMLDGSSPEAQEDNSALKAPSADQVVETDRTPAVSLKEDHKEAKADEDHHVHIHPHGIVLSQIVRRSLIVNSELHWIISV